MTECRSCGQEDQWPGIFFPLPLEVAEYLRAGRMCETSGSTDPTDLASFGEEEDDEAVKLKMYISWWEAELNENEYGNFPTDSGEECVQHRAGQCAGVKEDPDASTAEPSRGRGTGVLSPASPAKTTVIKACTRVHHPLTEVVTTWRTWQRRRRSRCGLTWKHWEPMCMTIWMQLSRPCSI